MATRDSFISVEAIRRDFSYTPERGGSCITRLVSKTNRVKAGCLAGTFSGGYWYIHAAQKGQIGAHRIVWALVTGAWPANEIDHIDGNGANNKFENLREATHWQNIANRGTQRNNSSGITGISWDDGRKQWQSYINASGKRIPLGRFSQKDAAIEARMRAQDVYHGEFVRRA